MRRLRTLIVLVLAALLLAGCAASRSVSPGEARKIFGEYRVKSNANWSRISMRNVEIWTVDGPQLQQLRLYSELEEGDNLLEIPKEAFLIPPSFYEDRPNYHEEMSPHDVQEMVTTTLVQWGAVNAHARGLRPAKFGGRDGFRFDIEFISQGGLEYRGLALARIDTDRHLYLVLYLGAKSHYFPKLQQEVENILASIAWM